jgi:hypothetical protein
MLSAAELLLVDLGQFYAPTAKKLEGLRELEPLLHLVSLFQKKSAEMEKVPQSSRGTAESEMRYSKKVGAS